MHVDPNYLSDNKQLWDAWAELHIDSEFYDLPSFKAGRNSLNRYERELLGDINGKSVLHLQCHFGQDTLSMARMGASVTGVDLSETGVRIAQELAAELQLDAKFVACNVLELDQHLQGQFDIVFASFGIVGWHPELTDWGRIVAHFLKPGGEFVFAEFHPMLWMFDDAQKEIAYSYFNRESIVEDCEGSYGAPDSNVKTRAHGWNHGLAEVLKPLMNNGLVLTHFDEYDTSHYNIFREGVAVEGGFQVKGLEGKLPLIYTLKMRKPTQ